MSSGKQDPVWVKQLQGTTSKDQGYTNGRQLQKVLSTPIPVNPQSSSAAVPNGHVSVSGQRSNPMRISESPLSARQILAGPCQPQLERPGSGGSVSSTGSANSQASLSRSNSGSSQPGTPKSSQPGTPTRTNSGSSLHGSPKKGHPAIQNLPNVSIISTSAATGPTTSFHIKQSRPDMIPSHNLPGPSHAPNGTQMNSSTPKVYNLPPSAQHQPVLSSNTNSVQSQILKAPPTAMIGPPTPTITPPIRTIAHPAFRVSVDESSCGQPEVVTCNGGNDVGTGSSSLPDLLDGNYRNTSACDESTDLVDLRAGPKRQPFRHSYSDGVPNALTRRRSFTMAEAKTHAFSRLQHELTNAQKELKLKDEECEKLSKVRYQMEEELEDLTASLFEEANKQVQDANLKRIQSEKLLTEANQKIEVLQAEVVALKQLVLTSTPNSPNKHLHPQIDTHTPKKEKTSIKPFWKTHRRSTSHHEFTKEARQKEEAQQESVKLKCKELDTACFEEFQQWRKSPVQDPINSQFFSRVFNEDVKPCLNFQNNRLATRLLECVERNCLTIEPIPGDNSYPRKCSLTESHKLCNYKIRLDTEDTEWYSISQLCRNRIAAVCDFYTYIRYIQQGLVKSEDKEAFYEISNLRRQMALAKLGYT